MADLVADRLQAWSPADWCVAQDWRELVWAFFASEIGEGLGRRLRERLAAGATIYPPQPLRALALTPLHAVKVVILGQDPYHGPGQAHGLAFSVPAGVRVPPSLRNIRREIARERETGELSAAMPPDFGRHFEDGDLTAWARQGVLLLNACMTVEQATPGAHAKLGWEVLTDRILAAVQARSMPIVFMWWGAQAQARRPASTDGDATALRLHLQANHPSPLSALRKPIPFMGCGHFALANNFLARHGCTPIDW
jgi:uracil-DNA glycosylase